MSHRSKRVKVSEQTSLPLQNNEGIVDLPSELLLEIVSHFPNISTVDILDNRRTLSVDYRVRFASLRALSQTCKGLRAVCLPLAWERLEACTTTGVPVQFFKEVGTTLERKCNGLMKSEHLLPYVRIVTVSLTRYQAATILQAFANCLAVLPNLHTIQVVHAHSQMTTPIKRAFEGRKFPSVRTVIMPSCAHEILRCCSGVEDLTCKDYGSKLVSALVAAKCCNLSRLGGISPNKAQAKRIGKAAPNLRVIQVPGSHYGFLRAEYISDFADSFKNLSTIEIKFVPDICTQTNKAALEDRKAQYLKDARGILKGSKYQGEKVIRLMYTQREGPSDERVVREYERESIVVE